jgi:hypothetical protein
MTLRASILPMTGKTMFPVRQSDAQNPDGRCKLLRSDMALHIAFHHRAFTPLKMSGGFPAPGGAGMCQFSPVCRDIMSYER